MCISSPFIRPLTIYTPTYMTKRNRDTQAICPPDTRAYISMLDSVHGEHHPLPRYRQIGTLMFVVGQACGRPHDFDYEVWQNLCRDNEREMRKELAQITDKKNREHAYLDGKDVRRDLFNESVDLVRTVLDREGSYAGKYEANDIALALNDAGWNHVMPAHVRAARAGR
jgi:hypothetical protein